MEWGVRGFAPSLATSPLLYILFDIYNHLTYNPRHAKKGGAMKTKGYLGEAKIFTNGGSQAVRLPAACRFQSSSVTIHKLGRLVILQEPQPSWDEFFARPRLSKAHRLQRGVQRPVDVRKPLR